MSIVFVLGLFREIEPIGSTDTYEKIIGTGSWDYAGYEIP